MSTGAWPARSRSRRAILLTALVHLALLALFGASMRSRLLDHPHSAVAPLIVQLWHDTVVPPPPRTERRVRRATSAPADARHTAPTHPPVAAAPEPPLSAVAIAPSPSASAASAPAPLRLDPDIMRRAIREATSQPSIGELAARASDEPPRLTQQQKLGNEIERSARGNCAKGEYAGGGMGLLSLPFFLIAEARDKCAH